MTATATPTLTEAAYAHLASFRHSERIAITGRRFYSEATVTTPQQDAADDSLELSYLVATDLHTGQMIRITVKHLLNDTFQIEHDDARQWDGVHTDWAAGAVNA